MEDTGQQTLAVQQLFVKHQGVLRGFLAGLVGDFNAVDDLVQEVFLVVTRRAESFELGTNFVAWACEIGKRKAMELAKAKHQRLQLLSPEAMAALGSACPFAEDTGPMTGQLDDCVKKLAPKARKIIKMRYNDDQKPGQIAKDMEWTPQAVYVSLSRSRSFLRDCLQGKEEAPATP